MHASPTPRFTMGFAKQQHFADDASADDDHSTAQASPKHASKRHSEQSSAELRYPRKRSVRACHLCRARKTKCDNLQPTCGFCQSIGAHCSYDEKQHDHSSWVLLLRPLCRRAGPPSSSHLYSSYSWLTSCLAQLRLGEPRDSTQTQRACRVPEPDPTDPAKCWK